MKRFVSIFIFAFLLFPMIVFAQNVEIKEVKMVEKSENAEIVANPKINELAIDFNIKLNALNDYVKYKVILNNKDDVDYIISKSDFEDNEYISYDIESDNLEKLEAKKEKVIYLKIKYEKKIPEEVFLDNKYVLSNNFSFTLDDGKEEIVTTNKTTNKEEQIKNPETGIKDYGIIVGVSIGVLAIVIYCFNRNKKFFKPLVLFLSFSFLIYPVVGKAIILMKFSMETTVTIEKGVALYEISINPNGGIYEDKEEITKVKLINGKTYNVSKPKREGFIFSRWEVEGKTSSIYDKEIDKIKIVSSDILLKAIWVSESNIIAKIKETGIVYESIQAAYEAAKDKETVILMNDTTENTINTKNITFDLNGHTQSGSLENKGDILLYGGSIKSEDIAIKNEGTLTLGFDDGEVNSYECKVGEDKGCVSVIGKNQGIDTQNGTFNFYDGYIKGTIGIVGGCKKTPYSGLTDDGSKLYYHATVDNDKNGYQYVYLTDSSKAVSKTITNGEVYYYNLQDNFNSSMISGYKVYAVRDFEAAYILSVNEDKKILFDVNGYNVQTGNDINNNGTLEIINSNEVRGRIESSHSIINNGLLKLSKVKVEGNSNAAIVINNKDLEMVSSTIKGSTGYGVSANESTGTIKMDDDSIIASTSNAGLYISKDVTQTITNGNVKSEKSYGIYNVGTLTLENVNVSSKSSSALYNYGKATFNSGTINSETNYSLYNSGDMIINGGTITGTSYVLYNYQNVEINGGTIKSENNYAFYNVSKATINGGEIVANKNSAIYNDSIWGRSGNIVINDGIIKTIDSSSTAAAIYNGSTLTITGGYVESTGAYGILTRSTLNIGKDNEELDTTKPIIKGATYGVYISGNTANFYDGILKGKTSGYYGEFSSVSDGALINSGTEIINSQEYNTNYLVKQQDFLEVNGKKYNSFEKALSNIESSGTIKVIADANINYAMTIPKEKEVILDLNGKEIVTTVSITNDGKFKITDTSSGKNGIFTNNKTTCIVNSKSANLDIENVTLKATIGYVVSNFGKLEIKASTLTSDTTVISNGSGNEVEAILENVVSKSKSNSSISNNGVMEINGGAYTSESYYSILNNGRLTINGGKVESTSQYAIYNQSVLAINDGEIVSKNNTAIYNTTGYGLLGKLTINGGTIRGEGKNSYGVYNTYDMTVTGGKIESMNSYGIYTTGHILTIGEKDVEVDITTPEIKGSAYGVYIANGIVNFYDGILKGKTKGYYGAFSEIIDGTVIKDDKETIKEEEYNTNYLVKQSNFLEVNGVQYNSFEKAAEAIENIGTIKVISNANVNYGFAVPSDKDITLDLNGKEIVTTVSITNDGKFKITDTSSGKNGIFTNNKTTCIVNSKSANLDIENVTLKATIGYVVSNFGKLEIKASTLTSDTTVISNGSGNEVEAILENVVSKSKSNSSISNNGVMEINGGAYTSESYYSILNNGRLTINGGKVESTSQYAIYNQSVLAINDGEIVSKNNTAIYNTTGYGLLGKLTINGGTIRGEGKNSYGVYNTYDMTVTGGKIESMNSYGIYTTGHILTIGEKDVEVDITTPEIKGSTYGVYIANGIVNFYDGILKGRTKGYYGAISNIEDNYEISENQEIITDETYLTNYLIQKVEFIQNNTNRKKYNSLKTAIDEANNNDVLSVLSDGNNYDDISIPDGKTITIDFNGNKVNTSKTIVNNGTLILKSIDKTKLNLYSIANVFLISNNNKLYLNEVYIKSNSYYAIYNMKNVEINNSKLEGTYALSNETNATFISRDSDFSASYQAIDNEGTFEIDGGSISSQSYGVYNNVRSAKESKIVNCSVNMQNITSSGIYNSYSGILNMKNVDIYGTISNSSSSSKIIFDTGNVSYSISNSGTMDISNINVKLDDSIYVNSNKSLILNTSKMSMTKLTIDAFEKTSYNITGIQNSGTMDISDSNISIESIETRGKNYGVYNSYGSINYTNTKVSLYNGDENYGCFASNGSLFMKNGIINVVGDRIAYGIYIENGTVTMGEKEDESGTNYGTINADVSVTNPSIKAISNTLGIGVKRVNGYFNYYDGIITGSTNAKPDVTSTVEYKYQVENHVDPATGYEYCILEYMKE